MRRLPTLLLLLALAAPRSAAAGIDNVGTTGANFLSLGASAGVLGMGGAAIGTFSDVSSIQWNAAALGSLNETQMVFSHAPLAGAGAQDWVGVGGRMGYSATRWAVNGIYQGDGSFDGRDALGNSTGSFNASSMAVGATFSHTFGEFATVGLGAKVVSEKLADVSGFGGTFDAGVQLQRGMFGFGLAAQNFGGRIMYGGVPYAMPTNIGAGVSYTIPTSGLRFALDYNRPAAYYGDVRAGVEWMWKGRVALRTGYRHEMAAPSNDALNGTTFGMGAGVRGIWFDYGYLAASNGDGEHRIALRVSPRMLNGGLGMSEEHAGGPSENSSPAAQFVPAETPAPAPQSAQPKSEAPKSSAPKIETSAPASVTATAAAPNAASTTSTAARTSAGAAPATSSVAAATKSSAAEVKAQPQATRGNRAQLASMAEAAPQTPAIAPHAITPPKAAVTPANSTPVPTSAPVPAPEVAAPRAESARPVTTNDAAAKAAALVAPPAKSAAVAATPSKTTSPAASAVDKITVKSGDSMADIARRFNTSIAAIMMENNLVSDHVKPGQKLKIPNHQ